MEVSGLFLSVLAVRGMAVKMKMRLPEIIGVEVPNPGVLIFHFTFLVSLHCDGGSASGATPVASGPRHCGQEFLESAEEAPVEL